jgi:hypothetical protein
MDGGQVDLDGFLNSCGRGNLAPIYPEDYLDEDTAERRETNQAVNSSWTYGPWFLER